ncbi:cysteine desulfurase family protein [Kurthia zopfii]|uniref:cysteine desulfurase family protein n=1 Tax=Kurthia zopfii TaxID=1650 RepID=UPI000F6E4F51|nr:aminotransferase class V-fold PLP-dependent enzyme [Kurthia zopfii]VEI08065.1 Cysteine desulfurase [Kurthia zopfii]
MLYLDNSATTQIHPSVKEKMLPFLFEEFGNASSKYYEQATTAKNAVDEARKNVALLLSSKEQEIVFTSGSTESNNYFIKGTAHKLAHKGNHIVTTNVEHPSVLECCKFLESNGFTVTYLEADENGRVSENQLVESITDQTILVSIMWGNNETGALNPIKELSQICLDRNIYFHTDATQVVGKVRVHLDQLPGVTFLSCSAHKFHGPKGIGVAFVRHDEFGVPTPLTPLLHGGGQENDLRSGTLALHNIVGIGEASRIAYKEFHSNETSLIENEKILISLLNEKFSNHIKYNNDNDNKIPGILSVQFIGVNNEILLKKLAPYIAASTGSACSSSKPSHVLKAIGLSLEEIRSTVRFSLSSHTKKEELDIFKSL